MRSATSKTTSMSCVMTTMPSPLVAEAPDEVEHLRGLAHTERGRHLGKTVVDVAERVVYAVMKQSCPGVPAARRHCGLHASADQVHGSPPMSGRPRAGTMTSTERRRR